jgi:predicted TIM-barrel fold metal-dependent hydrolase
VNKDDMILISVDDHIIEPPDMFKAHLPEKYKDEAPRLVHNTDGSDTWQFRDTVIPNVALNAVAGRPKEEYGLEPQGLDEIRKGCYDAAERVKDMNAGGVLATMNFPSFPGFAARLFATEDSDFSLALVRAYNDWHIDEWCGAYPGRFIPCCILPLFDVEEAAKEIRRIADKGCHAVTFSENPEALNMPSIHTDYWYPLFKAASENNVVLCTHVGSSSRAPMFSKDAPPSTSITSSSLMSAYTLIELVWANFWGDFPDLRFSLTEGDIGWIPYFLWRAEHVHNRHGGWTKATFPSGLSGPNDVFKKHMYVCFISDKVGPQLMQFFNEDMVCWESDYPHSDSSWPFAPEDVIETMGHLSDDTINKITHENAMRAYSFDPFAHIPKQNCRAGDLRSQATDVDVVTHVGHEASERDLEAWQRMRNRSAAR